MFNDPTVARKPFCFSFPDLYAAMEGMVSSVLWPPDIFAHYESAHRIFDLFAMGVHPEHRSRGIARKMLAESLEVE